MRVSCHVQGSHSLKFKYATLVIRSAKRIIYGVKSDQDFPLTSTLHHTSNIIPISIRQSSVSLTNTHQHWQSPGKSLSAQYDSRRSSNQHLTPTARNTTSEHYFTSQIITSYSFRDRSHHCSYCDIFQGTVKVSEDRCLPHIQLHLADDLEIALRDTLTTPLHDGASAS